MNPEEAIFEINIEIDRIWNETDNWYFYFTRDTFYSVFSEFYVNIICLSQQAVYVITVSTHGVTFHNYMHVFIYMYTWI